jgi:hypothetical protein
MSAKKKPVPNTRAPKGSYALPGGGPGGSDAYPIESRKQAVSALGRVTANGSAQDKATVRAAVRRAYPDLPSSKAKGGSKTAAHNQRTDRRAGKGKGS